MFVKKQSPSLSKLFSFHEKLPEEFFNETDVDSYFYHNILGISQSQYGIVRVSRGSNKKWFAIKVLQFCDLKTQQRYVMFSKKKWISPKENSLLWSTAQSIFSKLLILLASVYRFPYRSPKLGLDLKSQKTISLLITITISLDIRIDKVVCPSDLETTTLAFFPSKILNYKAVNLLLEKLST